MIVWSVSCLLSHRISFYLQLVLYIACGGNSCNHLTRVDARTVGTCGVSWQNASVKRVQSTDAPPSPVRGINFWDFRLQLIVRLENDIGHCYRCTIDTPSLTASLGYLTTATTRTRFFPVQAPSDCFGVGATRCPPLAKRFPLVRKTTRLLKASRQIIAYTQQKCRLANPTRARVTSRPPPPPPATLHKSPLARTRSCRRRRRRKRAPTDP